MDTSTSVPTEPTDKVQHIFCNAQITKKMEDVFINIVLNQAQKGEDITEYVVYLTTLGGSPFCALDLYNFLKALPQKTTVYNMGTVYSAGMLFFLGFQTRFGVQDCTFMIHQTTTSRPYIPETLSVFDLATEMEKLRAIDDKTHQIIEKETTNRAKTPLSLKDIQDGALKTTFFQATEAVEKGFIDRIEAPVIPSQTLYITDQWLATLPG